MTKFQVPGRAAAIEACQAFHVGATVGVYAEEFAKYGPGRNAFTYPGKVVGFVTLSGSDHLTGRVLVETSTVCHWTKSAVRNGTRTFQTVAGRPRVIAVWPCDLRI